MHITKRPYTRNLHGLRLLPKGIGLLLAVEMMSLWPDLSLLFGPEALVDATLALSWSSGIGWRIGELLALHPSLQIYEIASFYILCCVLLCWPPAVRLASLALLFINQAFFLSNYGWSYGVDYLAQTGLFISLLFYPSPSAHAGAHDWYQMGSRLIRWQLVVVYFFGGIGKVSGSSWRNGEAIWKAIQQPFSGQLLSIPQTWENYTSLWMVACWGVIILELGYALALLDYRLRNLVLICTVAMHIGIAFMIGLYHFAALMIWYNLCAWYYPYKHTTTTYKRTPLEDYPERVTSTT